MAASGNETIFITLVFVLLSEGFSVSPGKVLGQSVGVDVANVEQDSKPLRQQRQLLLDLSAPHHLEQRVQLPSVLLTTLF